jgi:signal peptide peptidase SppA
MTQVVQIPDEVMQVVPKLLHNWCGEWAILPEYGQALFEHVSRTDLVAHVAAVQARVQAGEKTQAVATAINEAGVMTIDIVGTLQKQASSLSGTSTLMLRRTVNEAAANDAVKAILLRIDSPGGQSAGTHELASAIRAASSSKPVWAYIEDTGASAAYWLASQASRVLVNETGKVGSIGTYMAVADYSIAAAQQGVKVHVIRAGEFKGAGQQWTEVTAAQLAEWQRVVNQINSVFTAAVATGRPQLAKTIQELADGRVHIGQKAVEIGLADGVTSYEAALAELSRTVSSSKGKPRMSEKDATQVQAASVAELKSACDGMSAGWYLQQLESGATLAQAQTNYLQTLKTEAGQLKAEATRLASELQTCQTKLQAAEATIVELRSKVTNTSGNDCLNAGGAGGGGDVIGDAIVQWDAAVEAKMGKGMSKAAASAAVCRENPKLAQSYEAEVNNRRRLQQAAA